MRLVMFILKCVVGLLASLGFVIVAAAVALAIWADGAERLAAAPEVPERSILSLDLSAGLVGGLGFARAANMYILQPVCNICRWGIPYAELAAEMQSQGFESGRIIVRDRELGGNLRRFFPDSAIALAGHRFYAPPSFLASNVPEAKTALLWPADRKAKGVIVGFQRLLPGLTVGELDKASTITIPWKGFFQVPYGNPVSSWRLLILNNLQISGNITSAPLPQR